MREQSREQRFDHVLETLRELPHEDPAAVDRILLAVKAASPKLWVRQGWVRQAWSHKTWRVIVASGAAAAAFVAGVVIGGDGNQVAGTTENSVMATPATSSTPATPVSQISEASILSPIPFELRTTHATSVSLVGDFNGWDPQATPMQSDSRGQHWSATVSLRPGRYTYAFVVDNNIIPDPSVPGVHDPDYGAVVSVVIVKGP